MGGCFFLTAHLFFLYFVLTWFLKINFRVVQADEMMTLCFPVVKILQRRSNCLNITSNALFSYTLNVLRGDCICPCLFVECVNVHFQLFSTTDGMFTFLTDGPKDTSVEDAVKITFAPSLKTLEEEVMEKLGIQETRRQKRSYWY